MLAHALVVSATASSLHVHEYVGHDHPNHHHGPSIHGHEHPPAPEVDHHAGEKDDHGQVIEPESCDPGRHTVSVGVAAAFVRHVEMDFVEGPGPVIVMPGAPGRSAMPVTDLRAHGPPAHVLIPSRAPPLIRLA